MDEAFRAIINLGYTDLSIHCMTESLDKEDHPVLQFLIKNVTNLFLKATDLDLFQFLPDLINKYKTVRIENNNLERAKTLSLI